MKTLNDVLILGAGPTGCALGIALAKHGAKVRLIEAVEHPEAVVGESMLPSSGPIFDRLGFDPKGFVKKHGAVFCQDGRAQRYDFAEAEAPRYTHAWQVQREVFDLRWRALAREAGCAITYTKATGYKPETRTVETEAGEMSAGCFVDAGGRGMWLSRKLGLREGDSKLRNAAIGTRMRDVQCVSPDEPGDITIIAITNGWIWIIPFGDGVASVGLVTTPKSELNGTPEEKLKQAIAESPDATARLRAAVRIEPLRGVQDFTAMSKVFHGDGFALCGDAAAFIDPVFSSGVLMGLHGAVTLADALAGETSLETWEARCRDGARVFRRAIDNWYSGDFMTLALAQEELQKPYIRRGIVTLLAGDVYDPARTGPRETVEKMSSLAALARRNGAVPQ